MSLYVHGWDIHIEWRVTGGTRVARVYLFPALPRQPGAGRVAALRVAARRVAARPVDAASADRLTGESAIG
jgi:hypothetical protein